MKKLILFSLLIQFGIWGYCQKSSSNDDYNLLTTALKDIAALKKDDTLRFYAESLPFENQRQIFSKKFFEEYTHPAVGVDNEKIKTLISILDFEYLAKQCRKDGKWNDKKINLNLITYNEVTKNKFKGKKQYRVSKPVYSKDKMFAFLYSYYSCGYPDCSSETLKIYKMEKGQWKPYTQIPISIS